MAGADANIERLVLAYLEKRGLSQTSRQLRTEVPSLNRPMTLAPGRDTNGVASELLFFMAADSQATTYAASFDRLADWVDNSLDAYKLELQQILYIVFIHSYLYLVKNDASSEATQLFSRHSHRFTSLGGQSFKIRMQEMNELQAVTQPEHLSSNKLAKAVRSKRTAVSISTYSHELLLNFLQASRTLLVLGIINDHLKMEIAARAPVRARGEIKEVSLLLDALNTDKTAASLPEMNLNLLKNLAEDAYAQEQAKAAKEEADKQTEENGKTLTKKARMAKQKAAEREVDALKEATEGRMEAEIPLPPRSAEEAQRQMKDIEARMALTSTALPSAAFFTFKTNVKSLSCCTVSANCEVAAGGFEDALVGVYDLRSQWADHETDQDEAAATGRIDLVGHTGPVYGVDLTRDNQLVLSASGDATLRLWHLELGACLNLYRGHNFPVWDVKAGPFGHYFASAGADRTCRIWSVERNTPVRMLAGHHSDVETLAWHPNSHYLATGSSDTSVRVWDMRNGTSQRVLSGHRAPVTSLCFHPEGSLLAAGDEDGQILIWDVAEGKQVQSLEQHSEAIWSLAYSSGTGTVLASGSADRTVCLWESAGATPSSDKGQKPLQRWTTKAAALFTRFTPRNLLICAGEQVFRTL